MMSYFIIHRIANTTIENQMTEATAKVEAIEQWFVERKRNVTDLALVST
ncbi:MAG: hypothetical protein AB7S75_11130 [Desulfococcaceae bacterium]